MESWQSPEEVGEARGGQSKGVRVLHRGGLWFQQPQQGAEHVPPPRGLSGSETEHVLVALHLRACSLKLGLCPALRNTQHCGGG